MQISSFEKTQELGHLFTTDVLTPEVCSSLIKEIKTFSLPQVRAFYNGVKQDFRYQQYRLEDLATFSELNRLLDGYLTIYSQARSVLNYCDTTPSIAFNHYLPGGLIDPHRDESQYRNIITIISLSGEANFNICQDRQTVLTAYKMLPGSMMTLRAPRNPDEKNLRPYHSVGPVITERYAIVIRHEVPHG